MKGAWTSAINALKNLVTALLPLFTPVTKLVIGLAKTLGYVAGNLTQILRVVASFGAAVVVF